MGGRRKVKLRRNSVCGAACRLGCVNGLRRVSSSQDREEEGYTIEKPPVLNRILGGIDYGTI
jgi:hypothetical protein